MAFVNEFVSEEDIKRHGLDELKKKYDAWEWRDGRPSTFVHAWTIDRERGAFLYFAMWWTEVGRSGRSQPIPKYTCVLDWLGERATLVIERDDGSSTDLSDSPFLIIWNLVSLDVSQVLHKPTDAVVQLAKEALTAYGKMGPFLQATNTIVKFNF